MKLALRLIGLAGMAVFGLAFALTFVSPIHVERAARGFVESEIRRHVEGILGIADNAVGETRVGRLAAAPADRFGEKIAALREEVASGLNERIAAEVARLQDLDCVCRALLQQGLDAATEAEIARLESAGPQLSRLIEGKYVEIIADLLGDLRIFTGSNALAFLAVLCLSIAVPSRAYQLWVPASLLVVATLAASAVYLFGQNWFFTVLYADYAGWSYAVWLALIFALLSDIVLFKARVTSRIINGASAVVPIPAC